MDKPFEQQIFDGAIRLLKQSQITVYPELPMKEVQYPFINMGDVQILQKVTSSGTLGTVHVSFHVWGERKQRQKVSSVLSNVSKWMNVIQLERQKLILVDRGSSQRILSDSSTQTILWHGIVDLEYKIVF